MSISKDIIIISGAPGSGKSTIGELLQKELRSPEIDFGDLREFHLLTPDWSDATDEEEAMTFENLLFIVNNYLAHGYKNVIIHDLKDTRTEKIPELFGDKDYIMVTLVVGDENVLRQRIDQRTAGFKDTDRAVAMNQRHMTRPLLKNEYRFDCSGKAAEVVQEILKVLQ